MKKFISMLLTLAMVISVCTNVVLAADTQATVGKVTTALSPTPNQLIYMDESMVGSVDSEGVESGFKYAYADFAAFDTYRNDPRPAPIKWPLEVKTGDNRIVTAVSSEIEIDSTANTLTSGLSGITYNLPAKITHDTSTAGTTLSGSEGLVLDYGSGYNSMGNLMFSDVDVANGNFDKIHILVATTTTDGDNAGSIASYVTYADGTKGYANLTVDTDYKIDWKGFAFTTAFKESGAAATTEGILGIWLPKYSAITETDRKGFLGELAVYRGAGSSDGSEYEEVFWDYSDGSMSVYEYTMDVDKDKEIDKIYFRNGGNSGRRKGVIILSIAGEVGIGTTPFYKDLTNNNTAKIYVDPTDPAEMTEVSYNKKNFLGRGTTNGNNEFIAINWPLDVGTSDERRGVAMPYSNSFSTRTVDDRGTEDTKDDIVYLTTLPPDHESRPRSGMTYTLTRDTTVGDGAMDAVLLCPRRADPNAFNGEQYYLPATATIPVHNAPYNRIAVLLAAAVQDGSTDNEKIKIYANYTDGTKSIADDSPNHRTGADGYIQANMPTHENGNYFPENVDSTGGPFIARLRASKYTLQDYNNSDLPATNTVTLTNVGTTPAEGTGYLFEYTLTLDPTKTVESITVEVSTTGVGTSYATYGVRGCAVLGVAGEQAVVANPADVADEEVAIEAYTTQTGDVYAAVYDKATKKLVAMEKTEAVPSGITNVTVNNSAIAADGEYDIKLFIWANQTFQPLTGATSVN